MSTQRFIWIVKGVGIGILIAWAALWSGDSPDLKVARLFDILDLPVYAVI